MESLLQRRRDPLTAPCQLLHLQRAQFRERLDMPPRQDERMARIRGVDVEKCHDEFAFQNRARRELGGEYSTKDTGIHAAPPWRTAEPIEEKLVGHRVSIDHVS